MPTIGNDRSTVIVVRAWIESDPNARLRARLITSSDPSSDEQTITVAASVEEVVTAVREWLEAFVAA